VRAVAGGQALLAIYDADASMTMWACSTVG
jgi:hypothetical protein